jgi:hypothetical protein
MKPSDSPPASEAVRCDDLFADWDFLKSSELVSGLKAREDSWDQLGHLALLIITALEEQTSDRELEGIEERARQAHRSVLRRGA